MIFCSSGAGVDVFAGELLFLLLGRNLGFRRFGPLNRLGRNRRLPGLFVIENSVDPAQVFDQARVFGRRIIAFGQGRLEGAIRVVLQVPQNVVFGGRFGQRGNDRAGTLVGPKFGLVEIIVFIHGPRFLAHHQSGQFLFHVAQNGFGEITQLAQFLLFEPLLRLEDEIGQRRGQGQGKDHDEQAQASHGPVSSRYPSPRTVSIKGASGTRPAIFFLSFKIWMSTVRVSTSGSAYCQTSARSSRLDTMRSRR